jgi:hypothetical protein
MGDVALGLQGALKLASHVTQERELDEVSHRIEYTVNIQSSSLAEWPSCSQTRMVDLAKENFMIPTWYVSLVMFSTGAETSA